MISRIPTSQIAKQTLLHVNSLAEIGCCTDNCDAEATHIALVEIKLIDGRKLSITKLYCKLCALALRSSGQA